MTNFLAKVLAALVIAVGGGFVLAAVVLAVSALFALPVYWLWNWIVPAIFGLKVITFWQAWGLLMLCGLLFHSSSSSSSSSSK